MTLKELRKSRNLTQETVAERAGMRPGRVSLIESGTLTNPELNTIKRLAHALDCTVGEVIDALNETYEAA